MHLLQQNNDTTEQEGLDDCFALISKWVDRFFYFFLGADL